MRPPNQRVLLRAGAFLLPILLCNFLCPLVAWCQSNSGEELDFRGSNAEIDVTIRGSSGEVISVPATVILLRDGTPYDQGMTSKGQMFFILHNLGDFTVSVNAAGYKSGQKDVSVATKTKYEVDVGLQRNTSSNFTSGAAGNPILAPKAKEALDKGMQALRDDDLDAAEIGRASCRERV